MRRLCLALAVGVLLLLVTGVGTATASPPVVQEAGQLAGSDQDAGAAAGTAQEQPTNSNASVRVLSPGDDGDASQTNEATSDATATNLNATDQSADQTQTGGGLQAIGQSAENEQDAFAIALTTQKGASNENAPVRVLSEGEGGSVTQENTASSDATAENANLTGQDADQTQSGDSCKCGSDGTQVIGQEADNDQKAAAIAVTEQEKPSNTNISVRVLSPGDDGDVSQTNEATSDATAGNLNVTKQDADQAQSGDCKCGNDGTQVIGQEADSDQKAAALAATKQEKPSNKNISVRVLSPGDDGRCKGEGRQLIGQSAKNERDAVPLSATIKEKPSNTNTPIRVLSKGDDGDVEQENEATSNAEAVNLNGTTQTATQSQAGGSGLQGI